MQNYLLYLVFDNPNIFFQTYYSILSLSKVTDPAFFRTLLLVIYTDKPEEVAKTLKGFNVEIIPLTREQFEEWKTEKQFFFRIKIKLLQDFFGRHPQGNLLYSDTDIVFKKDISSIFKEIEKGTLFMHGYEGVFDQRHAHRRKGSTAKQLDKILRFHSFERTDGSSMQIPRDAKLWNAGILGLSSDYSYLLPDVLKLADDLYTLKDAHIMEQFAFSWFFQQTSQVKTLEEYVFHYWNFKEFGPVVSRFFAHYLPVCSFDAITGHIGEIDPERLIKPKMEYERLPFFPKYYRKYFQQKWMLPEIKYQG